MKASTIFKEQAFKSIKCRRKVLLKLNQRENQRVESKGGFLSALASFIASLATELLGKVFK